MFRKIRSPMLNGWVVNEGGRVVLEWLRDRRGGKRLRFFCLGLELNIQNGAW